MLPGHFARLNAAKSLPGVEERGRREGVAGLLSVGFCFWVCGRQRVSRPTSTKQAPATNAGRMGRRELAACEARSVSGCGRERACVGGARARVPIAGSTRPVFTLEKVCWRACVCCRPLSVVRGPWWAAKLRAFFCVLWVLCALVLLWCCVRELFQGPCKALLATDAKSPRPARSPHHNQRGARTERGGRACLATHFRARESRALRWMDWDGTGLMHARRLRGLPTRCKD